LIRVQSSDATVVARATTSNRRNLNAINFFVAAVQTGFGPFIAFVLTENGWTQIDIGFALSIGTIAAMASQLPAGALVDRFHDKRLPALLAIAAIGVCALVLASWPAREPVLASEVLHGFASCMLGPAIAALTLAVYGQHRLGESLGHNARFASIGNAVAAGILGALGTYASQRAVFVFTAALTLPVVFALTGIGRADRALVAPETCHAAQLPPGERHQRCDRPRQIFRDKGLLVFAASAALFFLGSAAVLPIAVNELAKMYGNAVGLWLSASIIVPQIVVASLAPWIGRTADRWGRRPVLLLGFVALPVRALLFASMPGPYVLILVQALDGLSGAVFGVMVALVAADLTRRIGCLNLAMGTISLAISLGAALSTTLAGAIAGAWGDMAAFLSLAGAGCCAASLVWLIMPETRPPPMPAGLPAVQLA
jgi:MFS family permease